MKVLLVIRLQLISSLEEIGWGDVVALVKQQERERDRG
jgi:hypothetical protein